MNLTPTLKERLVPAVRLFLYPVLLTLLIACSSPEDKALEFLQRGENLLTAGEPVKAVLEFQNALQYDRRLAPAWYGLARVAQIQGRWDEAVALLGQVLDIEPEHLRARVDRGRILLAAGELEPALDISNATYEQAPENAAVLSLRAAVFYRLDDMAGAAGLARRALAIDAGQIDALIVLATERITSGDATGALDYLQPALEQDDSNLLLQLLRIEALNRLGQPEAVEQVYQRLITLYPEHDALRLRLAGFYLAHFREAEAERILRERVAQRAGDLEVYGDLLQFLRQVYGPDRARAELEGVIGRQPDNMEYRFLLASLQQSTGDLAAAAEALITIAADAANPADRHRATAMLAAQRWQGGAKTEAVALAEEILAEDPRNARALILKSSWLIHERELGDAVAALRMVLRDAPDSADALVLLARAHELAGARNLADDSYSRAFAASEQSAGIGVAYARFLVASDRFERAASVLEQGLQHDSNHLESLELLARIRVSFGEWAAAQALADRIRSLGDDGGASSQIMGAVYAGRRQHQQSIAAFEQAYQASSSRAQPMVLLVRAYASAGEYGRAHGFIDAVLEANPGNSTAELLRGQLFYAAADFERAEAAFREVVIADPAAVTAYRNLAATVLATGDIERAVAVLDEGLGANPGSFELMLLQAALLQRAGDHDAAIVFYEALHERYPDAEVVSNNLASALVEYRRDEVSLQRALQLSLRFEDSDVPHFKDTLGWTQFRLGNPGDAIKLIGEAARAMPSEPVFRYHLGMTHLALQDHRSARLELEKALELAVDHEFLYQREVEEALGRL